MCGSRPHSQTVEKELYAFLSIIKTHFLDFSIVKGRFRSRDDQRVCIVETQFDCFDGMEFALSDIKALVRMLSPLDRTSPIVVTLDGDCVVFSDGQGSIELKKLQGEFINNPFVTDDEMKGVLDQVILDQTPIIEETIAKSVVSKIGKMCRDFKTDIVSIKQQDGDPGKGYLLVEDRQAYYRYPRLGRRYPVRLEKGFLTPIREGVRINMTNLPYLFNKSDVTLEVRHCSDPEIAAIMHRAAVGSLSISTFGRSMLMEENG
jgi:hypothetical protein